MAEMRAGWRRVKFGDVVRQVKNRVDPNTSGLTRYVAGEHMDTDDLRIRAWGEIGDGYLGPAFHMRFDPGQVLYGSRRTYLRKVAVAEFEGICANTTFVLESAKPSVLLPALLPFVMQTEAFHEHSIRESKGSVNPYINYSDLAWYEFGLPPLDEQERIGDALIAAEKSLQHARALSLAAANAFSAYSASAFRGELAAETTTHERLGRIASSWEVASVGDVTTFSQYGLSEAPLPSGQYPILRMMNLEDGQAVENGLRYVNLPDDTFDSYRLEHGDVLFNRTNSIDLVGRTGVYGLEGEHVFASYLVRLRVDENRLSPGYLAAYLNGPLGRQQVLSFATKAVSQANVSASSLAKVLIPLPPREMQDRIVAELGRLRRARELGEERAQQAAGLKRLLLSKTGLGS